MSTKYNNKKVEANGIFFDSYAELRFYERLISLKKAGRIRNFKFQVPLLVLQGFQHNGKKVQKMQYVADFVVEDLDGQEIIIDIKTRLTDTQLFRNKIKTLLFFNPQYNVWIVYAKGSQHKKVFSVKVLYGSKQNRII